MRLIFQPFVLIVALAALNTLGLPRRAHADAASPCALLPAAAVEEVLHAPLATPPFRANGVDPSPTGDDCRYETATFRAITVHVDWTDGGTTFGLLNGIARQTAAAGLKGVVELSDGSTVRGNWDEARGFMCCQFLALRGEELVTVDVSGSDATLAGAASLANLAVKALDAPAAVDDAVAVKAASALEAARPAIVPVCSLLSQDEVEAILGAPLTREREGGADDCTYDWIMSDGSYDATLTLNVTWRGGFSDMRTSLAALGIALDAIDPAGDLSDTTQQTEGAGADALVTSFIGVSTVRKDVLLSIETGGMNGDIATALIQAAAAKL